MKNSGRRRRRRIPTPFLILKLSTSYYVLFMLVMIIIDAYAFDRGVIHHPNSRPTECSIVLLTEMVRTYVCNRHIFLKCCTIIINHIQFVSNADNASTWSHVFKPEVHNLASYTCFGSNPCCILLMHMRTLWRAGLFGASYNQHSGCIDSVTHTRSCGGRRKCPHQPACHRCCPQGFQRCCSFSGMCFGIWSDMYINV